MSAIRLKGMVVHGFQKPVETVVDAMPSPHGNFRGLTISPAPMKCAMDADSAPITSPMASFVTKNYSLPLHNEDSSIRIKEES
jgi:hypothetical protein